MHPQTPLVASSSRTAKGRSVSDAMLRNRHRRAIRVLEADDGTPVVTEVLPRAPSSVPKARQLVREALAVWELTHLTDAAELIISELSTNAVQHTRYPVFRVKVQRGHDGRVRLAVIDKSTAEPALRPMDDEAEEGRGLALVATVAHEWGTDALGWGKRVWADLEAAESSEQSQPHWRPGEVRIWHTHRAQALYLLVLLAVMGALVILIVHGHQTEGGIR
ncbi:ATP-binding protein [Streptomyces sp. NPDC020801]|uniref:ATP-binding protein n=1 Tax=Streptomyces sp. NPDC020801 TaxID=3365093 RepID=UPI00379BC0FE